jgi:putative ABC transport system permease protein
MGAVSSKTVADLRRRRLQTIVLAVVLFLGTSAATLALSILVETNEPFDHAFAAANGAHLVIDYDPAVSEAQLSATKAATGVTSGAGPWPVTRAAVAGKHDLIGNQVVSGRPTPDATVDDVVISAGRWWQGPGEIVLDQDTAARLDTGIGGSVPLYVQPAFPGKAAENAAPGAPALVPPRSGQSSSTPTPAVTLTVVGIAASVSTPNVAAWISPTDLVALTPDTKPAQEMLYRVDPSRTAEDLAAAIGRITSSLPANAVVMSTTYLATKADVNTIAQLYVPILLAFSVFALLAAAFTIANVVGGIVLTSYRDIGVMKAIGFTPVQVTAILVAQILVPVTTGAVAGVIVGSILSQPMVESTAQSFGLPASFSLSPSVVVLVLVVSIGVALLAAIAPAVRAGRLSPVAAISRGPAPSHVGDGGRLRRLGLRLPIAVPARLGLAAGVAHPVRATMTLGALVVGVAAVTFAVGMNLSLLRVMDQLDRGVASPVRVELMDPSANAAGLTPAIAAQPGTGRSVAIGEVTTSVRGVPSIGFVGYAGDASWTGYELIAGRWFTGAGEVVAPTAVFTQTGLHLGDKVDVSSGGRSISVRLVGEIFDTVEESSDHLILRGAWADLAVLDPGAGPTSWEIQPVPGTSPATYAATLRTATGGQVAVDVLSERGVDTSFALFLSVITFMGIVLVVISLGGVFDTVLLETRQRTREMAVLKALGMAPRQVVVMVLSSMVPVAVLAGLLGVPLGVVFQRAVLAYMGQVAAGTRVPENTMAVFAPAAIIGLALSGLAIAAIGAYLPAQRAARARIAPVLQAE